MKKTEIKFTRDCTIIFVDKAMAEKLIGEHDEYIKSLSLFDLQAKVQIQSKDVTIEDYLSKAKRNTMNWKNSEVDSWKKIIKMVRKKYGDLNPNFLLPDKIYIVQSRMMEEAGASGYTRQNFIVLNKKALSVELFAHELFHIISRYNQKNVEKIYGILGFKPCNEIRWPTELRDFKITNPDAPRINYYIKIKWNGKNEEAVMITYSEKDYAGGSFMKYIKKELLLIEGEQFNKQYKRNNDGEKILLDYSVVSGLYNQIGEETRYNIHPEEISAVHFSMIIKNVDYHINRELIYKMKEILRN